MYVLVIEPPAYAETEIQSFGRVVRELERIKALHCGEDVGAGEIGMEMLYAGIQEGAQIEIVANQSAVLVIELLHRRLVAVRIICGEIGDFRAELQICRLMEKREAVEQAAARDQCGQVQRVAAAALQIAVQVGTEPFPAQRKEQFPLHHMDWFRQLADIQLFVQIDMISEAVAPESGLTALPVKQHLRPEQLLFLKRVVPADAIGNIVAEKVVRFLYVVF